MTVRAKACPCGRLYLPHIGERPCHTVTAISESVPGWDEHSRKCLHYCSFGSFPCDCDGPDETDDDRRCMMQPIRKETHPSAYQLIGAVLGDRTVPGVVERGPDRWLVDWVAVPLSFLSSTEVAYLRIARGLAVLDTNGPGPAPEMLRLAVTKASER